MFILNIQTYETSDRNLSKVNKDVTFWSTADNFGLPRTTRDTCIMYIFKKLNTIYCDHLKSQMSGTHKN